MTRAYPAVVRVPLRARLRVLVRTGQRRARRARVGTVKTMSSDLTVGELHRRLGSALSAWGEVWLLGEVSSVKHKGRNAYVDVVERDEDRVVVAKLHVVLLGQRLASVQAKLHRAGVVLEEGTPVRLRGALATYGPSGALQLMASDIDPDWTLGQMVADKDAVLKGLVRDGLLETNKRVPLSPVPLRVALVVGANSAAEADFCDEVARSGVGFELLVVPATVQGASAPDSIRRAFERIERTRGWVPDAVALVRGGGSRSDLAAFDTNEVARLVALAPWPVLAGIGHEIDRSVVDEVAHASFKTPTAVAQALVRKVLTAHDALEVHLVRSLNTVGRELERRDEALARAGTRALVASDRFLGRAEANLERLEERLTGVPGRLEGELARIDAVQDRVVRAAGRVLEAHEARLERAEAVVRGADVTRVLERGFSVLRRGGVLVGASDLAPGDEVEVQAADGRVLAAVKGTTVKGTTVAPGAVPSAPREHREEEQ